ncbi:TPA: SEC-C metal-binding domain-containing protein [Bacillus cereus]|uniref:YecA family protein n=1 Tax=Bacillus cereus TaxID=1396 RepID=UPI0020D264A5|nr:SEC-C metal-binding domain-containing protein [Bacillus cereus]
MLMCPHCKKHTKIYDDIENCLVCGSKLEESVAEVQNKNNISINLDFTCFTCNCGHAVLYDETVCPECEKEITEERESIDPKVKKRKEKFIDIQKNIKYSDENTKQYRRELYRGILKKTKCDDYITFTGEVINNICELLEREIFKDISFHSEKIECKKTQEKISEIYEYITELYSNYNKILGVEVPFIWENLHNRLCNTVEGFLKGTNYIIESIVSINIKEAHRNIQLAQNEIDVATNEIGICSKILGIKQMEFSHDLFVNGNVDYATFNLMLLSSEDVKFQNINTTFNKIQSDTYQYFNEFLKKDLKDYMVLEYPILYRISMYRLMSMMSFSEKKFFEKIKIVNETLEKAKSVDFQQLINFLNGFTSKYIYSLKVLNDIVVDFALTMSYCKNEKIFIDKTIGWYKKLSEGVYKEVSSILIICGHIIGRKEIEHEEIIEWMGFPDKLEYLEAKKKLKLHKLAEGVEKIIRHSEAHVDYEIDEMDRKVIMRNKVPRKRIKEEKIYTYEDLFKIQGKLQETVAAILAGLEIFIANNYNALQQFMLNVAKEIEDVSFEIQIQQTFSCLGIINLNIEELYRNDKNVLCITAESVTRKDKQVFNNCISCIAPIISKKEGIDLIEIYLIDSNDVSIGSIKIFPKYIKRYLEVEEPYKSYAMLLTTCTSDINYLYDLESKPKNVYAFDFITYILKSSINLIGNLKELKRQVYIENIDFITYKLKAKEILKEFDCISDTIYEYLPFVINDKLLKLVQDITNKFIQGINKEIGSTSNIKITSMEDYKEGCLQIADIIDTLGEEVSIEKLLLRSVQNEYNKTGRNEPCLCGSGKKYKKCCL